ncbi:uncharacterized protein MEPE_05696 [Melanopsichium pennsylvanicum]|uniref:Uncharacterized protein n=2 Tax=Melanopsichium pennsylvanicum TaxID=63383 RepID=A0AAJ5C7J7_9BASI|nr:conserved hypothetical protein [Melanopsichium pennsylvanicum 4]SNX86987.1 uncharacterized protein MEPE_05696 [Melanopsichium pennsylvanicum]
MVSPINTAQPSASSSRLAKSLNISGASGTSTRNRLNAALGKQHFLVDPSTLSRPNPSKALFDAVPRNSEFEQLKPILARLPLEMLTSDGDDDDDDEQNFDRENLDYIVKRGVMYTRSRLPFLDSASVDLWKSLHHFRPLHADYASGYLSGPPTHPLPFPSSPLNPSACPMFSSATERGLTQLRSSFNWSSLGPLPLSASRVWYGVLFLSVRRKDSESQSFYEADRLAHEEATASGGLIMYWYGSPSPTTGVNLATCIWTSRRDAIEASKLPLHRKAAVWAAPSYERYDLVRYRVVKRSNEARLRIESWTIEDDRAEEL